MSNTPVVWSGENGDAFAIVRHFVTLVFDFMTPNNVVERVQFKKSICDVGAKLYADTAFAR